MELRTIVELFAVYAAISLIVPRILANPELVSKRPGFVLRAWFICLGVAALSLLAALVGLVGRALAQHVVEDNSARIVVPILENIFGWIALGVLGILVFRFGAALGELRSSRRALSEQFTLLISQGQITELSGHRVMIFDSAQSVLMAVPSAQCIMVSSHIVTTLSPELLKAALAHEQAHLDQRHGVIRAAGILAMAVAPGFSASERMAQATRITTELLADDAASRQFSPHTLAKALKACFGESPLIDERVARLES
ncbi:M48 family metalloprotease [Aurantimicrobium minutum]|uniref:M48 family metalloprotease n=1 Tax=Aurantimicrobium minutum TaxID=708131 RepID=UPI0024770B8B|nr:M48 family metalloprotease [Aurantimicrobium minutum]MDH6536985.1 beta-lactamase regulating signal transducer with metallopeptidase domain [Aurantimicrobium minutum]